MADRNPTPKASIKCFAWLDYCQQIGWAKESLDRLQALWWEYHDDDGNLIV
jgi:hypothetical protein